MKRAKMASKSVVCSIRVGEEVWREVSEMANLEGKSRNSFINEVLRKYCESKKEKHIDKRKKVC